MRYNNFWILAPALLLAFSAVPAHANLITDPGFESCGYLGIPPPAWTASGNSRCSPNDHTGSWDDDITAIGGTSSQTIVTVAGDNYDFSFWLKSSFIGPPNTFTASFGSNEVLDLVNPVSFSYTLEDFTVTAAGTSTTISFAGVATGDGTWSLDDISVTDLGPSTPEPASLVLLATGLLGIAWRFRHQRT